MQERRREIAASIGLMAWMVVAGMWGSAMVGAAAESSSREMVIVDFEEGLQDWGIPDWELTSPDYAAKGASPSLDFTSQGKGSLQLQVAFPGKRWAGAYVEQMMYVTDWGSFDAILADVYLPYNAPKGLKARIILTVGEEWTWTEMNRALALKPDQWTTIKATLKPGSLDWKFFPDESFRKDVRKVGIRIESDDAAYTGPVYIDNIRLIKQPS